MDILKLNPNVTVPTFDFLQNAIVSVIDTENSLLTNNVWIIHI